MPINNPSVTKTVSFTLPAEALEDDGGIFDAFAAEYRRPDQVVSTDEDDPSYVLVDSVGHTDNPESKEDFFLDKVMQYVDEIWSAYNKKVATKAAEVAVTAGLGDSRKVVRDNTTRKVV